MKRLLTSFLVFVLAIGIHNTAQAQFGKRFKNLSSKVKKKDKSSSDASKGKGDQFYSKNQMSSRFSAGFTNLSRFTKSESDAGQTYNVYYFGSNDRLAFKLYPRFAKDDYHRGVDGVFSSSFVKDGEEVYHIDELKDVTDVSGTKHSFTPTPSPSKRVIKTPDNVYLIYAFDGGKKIGNKYPYYVSSKSSLTGPFVIAAPSEAKFTEWSGDKALNYVKDFEKRVKEGCFKFMPKEGKLHTADLAEKSKQAIYKKLRQYKNNANLEIRRIVVYSDNWKEITDDATDEVISQQLIAYYLYVNGDDTDIHGAKISKKGNDFVVDKTFSDKFSKDIPVSLVNKYFK